MNITQSMKMDLVRRRNYPRIEAVQGDSNTRVLEISLYENGVPWDVPDGASALLRFCKPDGTGGTYDTLPDGSTAWSVDGNVVRFTLAPQVLACPGLVQAQLEIARDDATLASFTFHITVERDPSDGAVASEDYFNWNAWAEMALKQKLEEAKESGEFDGPQGIQGPKGDPGVDAVVDATLSVSGQAADAAVTGAALAGKAPAGYGYGGAIGTEVVNTSGDESDFNAKLEAVYSALPNRGVAQIQFADNSIGTNTVFTGTLFKYWANYGWLKGTSYDGSTVIKIKVDGVWQPLCWENPPMVLGVEYRTTERWNGKAVYTKLVYLGALPNATVSAVAHGAENVAYVLRCEGTMQGGKTIPYAYGNDRCDISCTATYIEVNSNYNMSAITGYATIWYVKG